MIYSIAETRYKDHIIYTMFDTGATWYEVDNKTFDRLEQAKEYIDKENN